MRRCHAWAGLYILTVPAAFVRLGDPSDPLRAKLDASIDPTLYAIAMLLATGLPAIAFSRSPR